jgi:hypothetical protein
MRPSCVPWNGSSSPLPGPLRFELAWQCLACS